MATTMIRGDKVEAYSTVQIWFHKHLIHFMLFLIISGLPIFSTKFSWMAYIFGIPVSWLTEAGNSREILSVGIQVARAFHRIIAFLFILTAIPFSIVQLKDITKWDILPCDWKPPGAISKSIKDLYICYIGSPWLETPKFCKYNIGQKTFAWLVIVALIILTISGFILTFRSSFSPDTWLIARVLHDVFFVLIITGLVLHVYLAVHPINRESLRAMFTTGEVDLEHVRVKHPKWYEQLMEERTEI